MSVINTNITSMIGQSNLTKSQNALQTSMERLSSGLRINSAKDDAAGQAIANRMTAQITGLAQAQRNANDGISIAQTAEGSLNQVNDNVQRIRELTVQAANSTNSKDDLQSIQDEINQRLEEINRISEETNFNGVDVLAQERGLTIQVGANDGETITVGLKKINAETLGLANLDVRSSLAADSLTNVGDTLVEAQDAVAPTTVELSLPTGSGASYTFGVDGEGVLHAISAGGTENYEATYNAETNTVTFDADTPAGATIVPGATGFTQTVDGKETLIELTQLADASVVDGTTDTYTFHVQDGSGDYFLKNADDELFEATVDASGNVTLGDAADASVTWSAADFSAATETLTLPGQAAVAEVTVNMTSVDAELDEGTNTLQVSEDGASYFIKNEDAEGAVTYYSATVNQETGAVTLGAESTDINPLETIDAALNQIDSLRSNLGAVQNRFEDAITNLNTNETNLAAARSRIEDADYAVEVANMTRAQILQQAGTSVLAQANQIPQNVLSLLG